jgi:hypothetical protein
VMGIMEITVHPAWRCCYYLFTWCRFYKNTRAFYVAEKHFKHQWIPF